MKPITYLLLVVMVPMTSSCFLGNNTPENNYTEESTENYGYKEPMAQQETWQQNDTDNLQSNRGTTQKQQSIRNFQIQDPKTGMVAATIPFPSNWRQVTNSREWTFKGPGNLKISGEFGQNFTYGSSTIGYGGNSRPPMNLQQIIEEFFMPTAQQTNRTLLTTYELPQVARVTQNYRNQLWQYAPSQKSTKAYALEWKDTAGMNYITVLNVIDDRSQLGSYWAFYGTFLQAPSQDFEAAKKAFIYGLENKQYNPQWIAVLNNKDINRANFSNAAHQKRMAAIQARGNASRAISKTYSDISDISHAGYLKRNNINSAGHSKTINMISENTVIANHGTGEHYTVPSGSNYYWVNNNGEYFGTNNANYDPRIDQNINNSEWTQFNVEN